MKLAIVGAGVAGSSLSYFLQQRGIEIDLYDRSGVAAGASGNALGLAMPHLSRKPSANSQLSIDALEFTKTLLRERDPEASYWKETPSLQLAYNELQNKKLNEIYQNHSNLEFVDAAEASEVAELRLKCSGLLFKSSALIRPVEFCKSLVRGARVINSSVEKIEAKNKCLLLKDGTKAFYDRIALCNSFEASEFLKVPLEAVRGQLLYIKNHPQLVNLKAALCHDGYCTPALSGLQVLGSSYEYNDPDTNIREKTNESFLAKLSKLIQDSISTEEVDFLWGRVSFRASAPGKMPIFGEHPEFPGLFILSGLGSRGISTGPFLAEKLAKTIAGKTPGLGPDLLKQISVRRFFKSKS